MFRKTIEALKATEAAANEEHDALWVPFDPATGSGGVHWHAAGHSILENALAGIRALREDLERRQAPIDLQEAQAAAAAAVPAEQSEAEAEAEVPVVSGGSTDDPTPAPEPTPTPEPEPAPAPDPAPEPEVTPSA